MVIIIETVYLGYKRASVARFGIVVALKENVVKKRIVFLVFIVLLVGVSILVYWGQRKVRLEELYYSGTIEATDSKLAFQVGGRVIEVPVDEGYTVEKDQVLAKLDQSECQKRYDEAGARADAAIESLAQLKTQLEIYEKTLPAEVERARANLAVAKDTYEEAAKNKERFDALFDEEVVSEKEWDRVTLNYDTAKARLAESEAVLKQALSNLKKIEAIEKEIDVAKAQVQAAEAAFELANIQLGYTVLKAPFGGIITSRNVEPGEVVNPSREVFTLSELATVDLKIFVDETEIGKVKPGQDVEIKIDTFPEKVYRGNVAFISPQGEFTPKIIQTHKERVKLVYLVKIAISNPELELKSGMPADAWLR
jgi:HlyD family secretion protein